MPIVSEPQNQWVLSGALLEFASEGNFDLVRHIVEVFLLDTELKVESLKAAVLAADLAEAQRIAHSIKGAARQMGTFRLADDAERLEYSAPESDRATFSLLVMAIAMAWQAAKHAVVDALETMPGNTG